MKQNEKITAWLILIVNMCMLHACEKKGDYNPFEYTSVNFKHLVIAKDTTVKIERIKYPISGAFIMPNSQQEMLLSVSAYANTKAIIQTNKGDFTLEVEPITNVSPDEVMNMNVRYYGYNIIHHTFKSFEQTPLHSLYLWKDLLFVDTLIFE